MDLKELLGDLYTDAIAAKIGDKKLAVINDGSYVPKSKLDEKLDEIKTLKESIKTHETQLADLSKAAKDLPELQQTIKDLQKANDDAKKDYEAKIEGIRFDTALERALVANKAKNPKAVKALLDTAKLKLDGENLLGLDDQLKALKTSDSYLFDVQQGGGGANPPGGGDVKNPWLKDTFNLTEQGRITRENPTLAAQLRAAAGK